jgi:hypothetical protein
MASVMRQYKLRVRDAVGTDLTIMTFDSPNDYEALVKARQTSWAGQGELWQGTRMVAAVKPWRSRSRE